MRRARVGAVRLKMLVIAVLCYAAGGCATPAQSTLLGLGIAAAVGTQAPGQEIEQIYYLGVFDPREQIPEAVYRIRVHGQASAISFVSFASGWVPAKFVDSLTSSIGINPTTHQPEITAGSDTTTSELQTGRRLVLFGPEGFREAPKDQRLVIVMGSNADEFFKAIDMTLGATANVTHEKLVAQMNQDLYKQLADAQSTKDQMYQLQKEVNDELAD